MDIPVRKRSVLLLVDERWSSGDQALNGFTPGTCKHEDLL